MIVVAYHRPSRTEMDYVARLQETSWKNLAILNEYKATWPDRDPIAVHEELFGTSYNFV